MSDLVLGPGTFGDVPVDDSECSVSTPETVLAGIATRTRRIRLSPV